jgi:hypothetical protein
MHNNNHTPGPWYYEEANIRNADGLDIATIDTERSTSRSQYDPVPEEEWIANTHLIAAAPDLLAALKTVDEYWAGGDVPEALAAQIHEAITKATGGDFE